MFPPLPDDIQREDWLTSEFNRTNAGWYDLHLAELRSRDALPDAYYEEEYDMEPEYKSYEIKQNYGETHEDFLVRVMNEVQTMDASIKKVIVFETSYVFYYVDRKVNRS